MTPRFLIVIPVYNNPTTVVEVIEGCLHHAEDPVLVVDDGSALAVQDLFKEKHPNGNKRVSFLRHDRNYGKGVALRSAFKFSVDEGYTHVAAIDADGQHDPADLPKLLMSARQNPWALIVGDREMKTANVPGSSVFGKAFSNFWVRYQTDVGVADSQSGYRVYPMFYIQNMRFFCRKYDFEIEVLTRLIWKGVAVKNVPVSVKYFPPETRVSHFHKWKDNFRITQLNTILTITALLKEQTTPFKSSLAFAIGIFIGCTPLYGFHTALVAAASFFGRLNFVYLWVGSHISMPPMIPFLVYASNSLGYVFFDPSMNSFVERSEAFILGSVLLGLICGVAGFVILYTGKKILAMKKSHKAWMGNRERNKTGIWILRQVLERAGLRTTYFFLYFVAFYYFLFSWRTRVSFTEYWKRVRPQTGGLGRQWLLYKQVLVFAQTLVDRGLQRERPAPYFEYEIDAEADLQALDRQKGIIQVSTHYGGWELASSFFAGASGDRNMLAIKHGREGQYDHGTSEASGKIGAAYYNLASNTIIKIREYLSQGHAIGIMGDRPVTAHSELEKFFGRLALFDITPFRIANVCAADIYFVFVIKLTWKKYRVCMHKAKPFEGTNREEKTRHYVKQYAGHLERLLSEHPEQWFNFFPFWSEAPESVTNPPDEAPAPNPPA